MATFQSGRSYRFAASEWMSSHTQNASLLITIQEVGSYHAMLACVASGQSFSFIPQSVLELCSDLSSVGFGSLIPSTTWLVWRSGYSTASFHAFREILQDTYSEKTKC
jgi:DNA-binding transcriptional LysR family regulator